MNARTPASHRLRFPFLPLLVSLGAVLAMFGGCALNTHGTGTGGSGTGGAPTTCNSAADCDDDEPCTEDKCGADKLCTHTALETPPVSVQTAGDCKTVVCVKGKAKDNPDNSDIFDDGSDCTNDTCLNGEVKNTPKPDGTTCDLAGSAGRCDAFGECKVACKTAADCENTNPCVTKECDTTQGVCNFPPVSDGTQTKADMEPNGDCQITICLGGVEMSVADDSDVPKTNTDCDTEVCNNGVPSNPGLPNHNLCSTYMGNQPGFCDGNGTCQECTQDADCPGPTDDCKRPACDPATFKCFQQNTPVNTPTSGNPPQVGGDCQSVVCDGSGGTMVIFSTTDPEDDNNECKADVCVAANTTQHNNVANGINCGVGGMLACVNGACAGCTMNSQCPQDSCNGTILTKPQVCNLTNNACEAPSPATQDCAPYLCTTAGSGSCTTSCTNDNGCSQGGVGNWCNAGSCVSKIPIGQACGGNNQCQSGFCVDGVCCNTACNGTCQACTTALKGSGSNGQCGAVANGTDPNNECPDDGATSCDRDGFCNGAGACRLYAAATVCGNASCAGGTLTKQRTCDGGGNCLTPNPATQDCTPYLCVSNACTTTCTNDSQCAANNWCNNGSCVAKLGQGGSCTGNNQCLNNTCVDGYCCNNSCNSPCMACAASLKANMANNGQCGAVPSGVSDSACTVSTTCGNTGLCAAGGSCQQAAMGTPCAPQSCSGSTLTMGMTCSGTGQCNQGGATSQCPGNLKCNGGGTACLSGCGTNDNNCVNGFYCDGVAAGACNTKIVTGMGACGSDHECVSGHCGLGNNVCCTASCPVTASSTCGTSGDCNAAGACQFHGTTTSCSASTCASNMLTTYSLCDGTGTCDGGATGPAPCANGFACADATSCRTTCSQASHCQTPTYTCAGNACKLANGSSCSADNACASGICGTTGTGHCCSTACTTGLPCGATDCNASGACNYAPSSTDCIASSCTGNMLTAYSKCSGSGACTGSPSTSACSSNLVCQDATQCWATCGANTPMGDAKCVSTHYCDGTDCQTKKADMATCARNGECQSNNCNGSSNKCM